MNVAIRVDASAQLGIGHFMRCLTLADALRAAAARVRFVTGPVPGHLARLLHERAHERVAVPESGSTDASTGSGAEQARDAALTVCAIGDQSWDWVVVDHYGLAAPWEIAVRQAAPRVMVIDDLANRDHACELLLDQNFYADGGARYTGKVTAECVTLLGPQYALLREEFRDWRPRVAPRGRPVQRILVCFGGADTDNYTSVVLCALDQLGLPLPAIDVVIGAAHAGRERIERQCHERGFACHLQSDRIAELMAGADLSVGAGGSMTWERCALGLPAFVFILAENQRQVVRDGAAAGFLYAPDSIDPASPSDVARHLRALMENAGLRQRMSMKGLETVDASGVSRVVRHLSAFGTPH